LLAWNISGNKIMLLLHKTRQ